MTSWSKLALAGCFLLVLGLKLIILAHAASPMPFLDEWDGEGFGVLKPFGEGGLHFIDLFQRHNEHIILFTRLLTLAVLGVSHYWDVVLQMIANAIVHATTIVLLAFRFGRLLPLRFRPLYWAAAVLLAAVPFGWESLLWGFVSQFYFLMLFSMASLALLTEAGAFSWRWWLGTLLAVASFFSMASGALTLLVVMCLSLLQMISARRASPRDLAALAVHGLLTLLAFRAVPELPGYEALRAHSFVDFLVAATRLLGWPAPVPLGLVFYLPILGLAASLLRAPFNRNDPRWFPIAVCGFVIIQVAAIALGRANGLLLASRYFDLLQIGMMANFAAALALMIPSKENPKRRFVLRAGMALWCVFLSLSVGLAARKIGGMIETRRQMAAIELQNARDYFTSGDSAHLAHKPAEEIGYPWPPRLREALDDPTLRKILPPSLNPAARVNPAVESIKAALFAARYWFTALGLLLWLIGFAIDWRAQAAAVEPEARNHAVAKAKQP